MSKKMLILVTLAVMLSACLPSQQPAATVDVRSEVNTAVAQTMQVNTQIAEAVVLTVDAQRTLNTPTPESTATFEVVQIFTDTPFPSNTPRPFPTNTASLPIPPAAQQPYSCFVLTIKPDYLEEINAGANFEIRWNIKNTGARTWDVGLDLKYASGTKMTNPERVEIGKALAPGESYKISLTGKAPNKTGVQQMTWIVEGNLCYANVVITVK